MKGGGGSDFRRSWPYYLVLLNKKYYLAEQHVNFSKCSLSLEFAMGQDGQTLSILILSQIINWDKNIVRFGIPNPNR